MNKLSNVSLILFFIFWAGVIKSNKLLETRLLADQEWNIQFTQSLLDCDNQQVCYQLELQSASGSNWGLGDQNYRLFFDGDLMTVTSVVSLLPSNFYGTANIDQNIKITGQGQEAASPLNDIDDNLGFLDFSIVQTDKSNPAGTTQISMSSFISIAEICVDVEAVAFDAQASNNCLAFYHSRLSTAGAITNQYTVISENDSPGSTVASSGNDYADLTSMDNPLACLAASCSTDCANLDTEAPMFNNPPQNLNLSCEESIPNAPILTATDNLDDEVTIIFEESQQGAGCNFQIIRTWTAIDDCENTTTVNQILFITDQTAPVISTSHPLLTNINSGDTLVMQCGATTVFDESDASVMDNCDNNPSLIFEEGDIIVSSCAQDDFIVWMECYWEATDECGNTSQFLIFVKVVDTTLPQFDNLPADLTISCEAMIPTAMTPSIQDNCTPVTNLTIIFEEVIITGNCESEYTIIRTWSTTDECSNSNSVQQTITIENNVAPEILNVPSDTIIDETAGEIIPNAPILTGSGNCEEIIMIDFSETTIQGICQDTITRVWVATDDCDNTSSATQTILVILDCDDCQLPQVDNIETTPTICNLSTGTATIHLTNEESDYTFTWVPNFGTTTSAVNNARENLPAGDYLIIINYLGQASCEDKVELTIEDDCNSPQALTEVVVFSGFSPNGDGLNDTFTINQPKDTPSFQVAIFNRWGKQVFSAENYKNDWGGTFQAAPLPDGTYFYVLTFKNGNLHNGYVQIHR